MAKRDAECVVLYVLCVNVKIKGECVCGLCFLHLPSGHNSIPCPLEPAQSIIIPYLLTLQFQLGTAVHHKFISKELCGITVLKIRTKERVAVFILQATVWFIRFLCRIVHFWTNAAKTRTTWTETWVLSAQERKC